ncbi:amidohydrolase family protein [Kordiimonas sp. SCSIO 12603]|uniref:amidohydrolase family protein n=1 Tax=Kordiimonas sp. SCSIO 12603 TaxID=2829596 RepID=UPI00210483BB|nr:amidohydrolase family protein [Kordiimonas sp. SCSIO 12603]UTW60124.1 amidohydrolase family protein [Kordiimonas sp. SCSIO 12603]
MKFIPCVLASLLIGCSAASEDIEPAGNGFILQNVNVVDVANRSILSSKTIRVENGKITSITDVDVSDRLADLPVIEGKGGYVTPGLIDMHVHMYERAAYVMTLSHGVTHVRIMNGVPKQLEWRDKVNAGEMIGSSSTVSSPIISGYKGAYLHHGVETAEEAREAVRQYHGEGYDLIKLYGNLSEEALKGAVAEGKRLDMPMAKHGPHASGEMPVGELKGLQSFEHAEDIYQGPLNYKFEPDRLPGIIAELKATEVPLTPTLNIFYQLTKLSEEKEAFLEQTPKHYTSYIIALEAKKNQVDRWLTASDRMVAHNKKTLAFLQLITKQAHEGGIPLLVGSDSGVLLSPHGLATHTEMRLMKEAGLDSYEVLAAATINSAKALGMENQIGQVVAGYNADFIYTASNPADDLSVLVEPAAVAKAGHWYTREKLDQLRVDAIKNRSFWEEVGVLFGAM